MNVAMPAVNVSVHMPRISVSQSLAVLKKSWEKLRLGRVQAVAQDIENRVADLEAGGMQYQTPEPNRQYSVHADTPRLPQHFCHS